MGSRTFVAFISAGCVLPMLVAGCGSDADVAEATYSVAEGDAWARVWIPINEPRSVGTYRLEADWGNGHIGESSAERDGMISGVWLSELDGAEGAELVVAMTSAGSGSYGGVHVYALRRGETIMLDLSSLGPDSPPGYMGHDSVVVKDGVLLRSYPVYLTGDSNAEPTGGTARLRYSFDDSSWVADDGGRLP